MLIAIGTEPELKLLEDLFAVGNGLARCTGSRRRSAGSPAARSARAAEGLRARRLRDERRAADRAHSRAVRRARSRRSSRRRVVALPEVERAEVAGPGLPQPLGDRRLPRRAAGRDRRATTAAARPRRRERIQVEMVSANPTGPLTVASARNAAYGDSVARLLEFAGHDVEREYYWNDAGLPDGSLPRVGRRRSPRRGAARGRLPRRLPRRSRRRGRAIRCPRCSSGSRRRSSASASTSTPGCARSISFRRFRTRSRRSRRTSRRARSGRGRPRTATTRTGRSCAPPTAAHLYYAADVAYLRHKLDRFDSRDLRARRRPPRVRRPASRRPPRCSATTRPGSRC